MDLQIKTSWILFGIASLFAWAYLPACVLYIAVICLMLKRVCRETDHAKFERATLLLMLANVGFVFSVVMAAALGHYSN